MDSSHCCSGSSHSYRDRGIEPRCRPVLSLMVTIDISKYICCFAPFCNAPAQKCASLHRAPQGAPCSALKLGVLPQYHPEPMPAKTPFRFPQSRNFDLKTFQEGTRSPQIFICPCLESIGLCLLKSS